MGSIKQLRDAEPFDRLPDDIYQEVAKAVVVKKFPPHSHIFGQNDPPTGFLYVIKEGEVEIVALTPGGVEMVVDVRREGSFLGATPVFTNEAYTAGARTVTQTECYLVPQERLAAAARRFPPITEFFTKVVFSRVRNLYAEIVSEYGRNAATEMEAYPFQKQLSEIMSSPVEICNPSTPIREVARRMTQKRIASLLVCGEAGELVGIITERDLVTKVLAGDALDCDRSTASEVMTPDPFTMSPSRYMYEAMSYMLGHRIKHLPVVECRKVVGIVSLRDLTRFRSQKAMLLVGSVKEAQTIEELVTIRAEVVKVAKALLSETRSPFETMEILSYLHHCILRRCYEIVLAELEGQGKTPPDIRFCLIIMGSGGRREMLLGPDQDNGFIYEDFPDSMVEEVDAFFVPFADRLVAAFDRVGYPLCNGKVMANNPLWRGRLKEWKERVADWIAVPEPKKVMYSTIFFDFMPLVGDPALCQELRDIVHEEIRSNPAFLYFLLENDLKHKPPLNLLGRFVVEKSGEHKGKLSLKQAGSVFIIDCIRMFLLEQGIDATTTVDRLEELVRLGIFNQETAEHLKAALASFTFLRLRHEIALIDQGRPPSHYIDPYALSKNEQDLLKEAFRAAAKLQDSTRRHFGQGIL